VPVGLLADEESRRLLRSSMNHECCIHGVVGGMNEGCITGLLTLEELELKDVSSGIKESCVYINVSEYSIRVN
jgi:hypothetical protein